MVWGNLREGLRGQADTPLTGWPSPKAAGRYSITVSSEALTACLEASAVASIELPSEYRDRCRAVLRAIVDECVARLGAGDYLDNSNVLRAASALVHGVCVLGADAGVPDQAIGLLVDQFDDRSRWKRDRDRASDYLAVSAWRDVGRIVRLRPSPLTSTDPYLRLTSVLKGVAEERARLATSQTLLDLDSRGFGGSVFDNCLALSILVGGLYSVAGEHKSRVMLAVERLVDSIWKDIGESELVPLEVNLGDYSVSQQHLAMTALMTTSRAPQLPAETRQQARHATLLVSRAWRVPTADESSSAYKVAHQLKAFVGLSVTANDLVELHSELRASELKVQELEDELAAQRDRWMSISGDDLGRLTMLGVPPFYGYFSGGAALVVLLMAFGAWLGVGVASVLLSETGVRVSALTGVYVLRYLFFGLLTMVGVQFVHRHLVPGGTGVRLDQLLSYGWQNLVAWFLASLVLGAAATALRLEAPILEGIAGVLLR